MRIKVREPELADVFYLGKHLRDSDVREIEGLIDVPPPLVVQASVAGALFCRVVTIDGTPCAVFGVTREPGSVDSGLVWLMGTDDLKKIRTRFLRESKAWLKELWDAGNFLRLHNIADHRNTLHIRWLKWLGAEFYGDMIRQHYQKFEFRR